MGLLDRIFKKKDSVESSSVAEAVEYKGYLIQPAPKKEKSNFHTAGYIRKEGADGQLKEKYFIRADTHTDMQPAIDHSVLKGKQIIDEARNTSLFEE